MPSRFQSGHSRLAKVNGPVAASTARTSPMGHVQFMLMHVIPHAYANAEHYDQRRLVCANCGNVPRKGAALLDTEAGYICKAAGACAKRAREI